MSIQAYQQAANKTADPRDVEYRLLAQVTRALLDVQTTGRDDLQKMMSALDWNRRVWNALAMDCAQPDNQLPEETRAGVISLSLFVTKFTSEVARGEDEIETLIDINRSIMQGLSGQGDDDAETAAA